MRLSVYVDFIWLYYLVAIELEGSRHENDNDQKRGAHIFGLIIPFFKYDILVIKIHFSYSKHFLKIKQE